MIGLKRSDEGFVVMTSVWKTYKKLKNTFKYLTFKSG